MGGVVRRYIDILTIIINFPYSTCNSSFFGSSIPTSLFIFKMFFRSLVINGQLKINFPSTSSTKKVDSVDFSLNMDTLCQRLHVHNIHS